MVSIYDRATLETGMKTKIKCGKLIPQRVLHNKLANAFVLGSPLRLTSNEVCELYLRLARLTDIEEFGYKRDWKSLRAYCS